MTNERKDSECLQVSLDVASRCFNVRSYRCAIRYDDLIADIISEDVVVLVKYINGPEVLIHDVGRPRGGGAVNGAVQRKCKIDSGEGSSMNKR